MTLLSFHTVSISYARRGEEPFRAVNNVSLAVASGELVTIVGESGSGKSTLIRSAIGLLPHSAEVSGRVMLGDDDVLDWSQNRFARVRGSYVGFVPQDPAVSLNPVKTIGRQLEDGILAHRGRQGLFSFSSRVQRLEARSRALQSLDLAGLPDPEQIYSTYPHELSGGMKQRVLIAIALSGEPELLIADEPTSALDVTVQKQILDHLDKLRSELGIGILMVTHDLGVALERSDRVVVMRNGSVVERGSAEAILTGATDPYTQHLLESAPGLHGERLVARPLAAAAHIPAPPAERPALAIEVRGVSKTFHPRVGTGREAVTAAADVSFEVASGTTHALVGESGAGKSTVARIVAGLRTPDAGEVRLLGSEARWSRKELSRHLQFVYQNPFSSLDPKFSVADLISEPLRVHRRDIGKQQRRGIALDLLEAVQLPRAYGDRKSIELSGGQAQRVAIARALSLNPEIVILDEAVSALDVSVQAEILQLLTDLQSAYSLSYLFITHDLGVVKLFADTVSVLRKGSVVESGSVAEILSAPREDYTRRLVDSVPGTRLAV